MSSKSYILKSIHKKSKECLSFCLYVSQCLSVSHMHYYTIHLIAKKLQEIDEYALAKILSIKFFRPPPGPLSTFRTDESRDLYKELTVI